MLNSTIQKIIFISASLISVCTYASNLAEQNLLKIDHKMLVGDWNCKEQMEYSGYQAKSLFAVKHGENQFYSEKGHIQLKNESTTANFNTELNAKWHIEDDILTIQDYKLVDFKTDNSVVESEVNFEKSLNDPDAVQFKIKKLTEHEMILNLILFDHEVENLSRICTR